VEAQVVEELLARYPDLRMSYEEFLTSGHDVHGDWVDGQVRLIGSDTTEHNRIVGFLVTLFILFEEERGGGKVLSRFQMRPRPDLPSREVDLLVLKEENRGRMREYFVDGPADLVIEVVMDESRALDTVDKVREYAQGGVGEYWVIDPDVEQATVYRLGEDGSYEAQPLGEPPCLRSEVMPGMWIDPAWLWTDDRPLLMPVLKLWGLI
jgi:Uma2 family endonuclease